MSLRRVQMAWLLPILLSLSACGAAAQDEQSSENDERLRQRLERHPDADNDKDGVLTLAEWRAYRGTLERPQREHERTRGQEQQEREHPQREAPEPTHADISYCESGRHALDLYLAQSATHTPLVIYFHGGGFVGGDKRSVSPGLIRACHANGISVAAANYRFITTDPFPAPFHDAARAIQFLRHHANVYNIDPSRLGATGGSAGGGISLWLAFHDDLADPDSPDPVARQSTRLTCAQVNASQVSYDLRFWHEHGMERGLRHPSFAKMYGLEQGETTIDDPDVRAVAAESSPIHHLSADDPPVMLTYSAENEPITATTSIGAIVHHPKHGFILKERMDGLGIECIVVTPASRDDSPRPTAWLIEHLAKKE